MMTAKSDKRRGVVRVTCDLAPLDLSAFFTIQAICGETHFMAVQTANYRLLRQIQPHGLSI